MRAAIDGDAFGASERASVRSQSPRADEGAIQIEDLDPAVLSIGDIYMALRTADEDVVWLVEIAGRRSFVSPRLDKPAVLRKFHDAGRVVLIGCVSIDPDESTKEAIGDWHYWVAQGCLL